ncbi:hypothetical protein M9H77_04905 [Catharanthus roseus]|uniref:Uncharacterized protein n=1 Tax=Catharanthus roseus TaxID=4058 RepID=A0ACC0CFD8_CATRO|nr:hypothetical protein M9H77_04905 [Catharanthus roseus]
MENDDSCEAFQADDIKIPERKLSEDDHQFYIAFQVKFSYPPAYQLEDEDDYMVVISGLESASFSGDLWAKCKFLESGNLSWNEISKKLSNFRIPLHKQPFMVHRISACADEIARKDYNKIRKILPIFVSINVVVDYEVCEQDYSFTVTYKKAAEIDGLKAIPANEATIQGLEDDQKTTCLINKKCMVCLDGIQIGEDKVRRMPCLDKHVFHEGCIFNWLRVSGFCPVCRFQLPA